MRVSTNNWGLNKLEKTYQQVGPKVQKPTNTKAIDKKLSLPGLQHSKKIKTTMPEEILSNEEKITLKRLFEAETSFAFYGKANTQKITSGLLLDVTG